MHNETLFYICGIALAVSAVVFSFIGLKVKSFPGRAFPLVVAWFAILVIGSTTFSVLHAQDEQKAHAAEDTRASEENEAEGADVEAEEAEEDASQPNEGEGEIEGEAPQGEGGEAEAEGPGGTLQLAADPAAIAYDTTTLSSKPGKVTIDFDNPAPLEHDVVVEDESGTEVAATDVITESKASAEADLAAGSYTFFCSVPGHREAGMEGTLTVR